MRHSARLLGAYLMVVFALTPASSGRASDHEISKADYFVEGLAPVRKAGPYDLTIVYFMDYQCPACRKYTPDVARALNEDRRIRVIYRDTPLLGPRSDEAARAAIASGFQGRHEPFHYALMMTKGPLDESAIKAAAQKAGVNWSKLQRDLISRREDIDFQIGRNVELATLVGILGTPAFIVGERQSNGALDYTSLRLEIADARKEAGVRTAPDEIKDAMPKLGGAKNSKLAATQVPEVALKNETKGPTVVFQSKIKEPRVSSNKGSEGGKDWMWLLAAVVAGVGVAVFWGFAGVRRKSGRRLSGPSGL